jgi:hypothetical protein
VAGIYLYQIYYNGATKASMDPGFIPLDNSKNDRPDWREYHPIRNYLLSHQLEPNTYYGFFSPRLAGKTTLTAAQIKTFVNANANDDVVSFSPFFDQSAFFLSIFEQGERHHPGLLQETAELAKAAGIDVDLQAVVTDSTNTVFSNYFVARTAFWQRWFDVAEMLYERAERSCVDRSALNNSAGYRRASDANLKVFVMERLAALLLATDDRWRTAAYDPMTLAFSAPILASAWRQAVLLDALKVAYRRLKNRKYLDEYQALRNDVAAHLSARQQSVHTASSDRKRDSVSQ